MRREYTKTAYAKWDDRISVEEAIQQEDYAKLYFLDETTIGRMDVFEPGHGLFKVSYRLVDPPFESLLDSHFREQPNVLCEVVTPPALSDGGVTRVYTYLFDSPMNCKSRYELHFDLNNRVIRSIMLSAGGEYRRDERKSYDAEGEWLSTSVFDGAGNPIRVYHRDDD
jgi:hypothetical protein